MANCGIMKSPLMLFRRNRATPNLDPSPARTPDRFALDEEQFNPPVDFDINGAEGYDPLTNIHVKPAGSSIASCGSTNEVAECSGGVDGKAKGVKTEKALVWAHVDELAAEVAELKKKLQEEEEQGRRLREEVSRDI